MIAHPVLAMIGLTLLILLSYFEIKYFRAGFPKSLGWLSLLFVCGAGSSVGIGLALIPEPVVMFQNVGACGVLLFAVLLGGGIAIHTIPRYAKEAERNRQQRNR